MNNFYKHPLLFAILGLAIPTKLTFAETNSGSSSAVSTQNPKTSAKAADQPDAKTSVATTEPNSAKASSASGKEDSASTHPVAALQGQALFKLIDTDNDGRISSAEFIAYGTAPSAHSLGSAKTSPGGNVRSDSHRGSVPSNASTKSDATAAIPEIASPGAGMFLAFFARPARTIHHPQKVGLDPTHAAKTELATEALVLNRKTSDSGPISLIDVNRIIIELRHDMAARIRPGSNLI